VNCTAERGQIPKKISTCKLSVYFYEKVAQKSHKNINQEILENIVKNTNVYGPNGPGLIFDIFSKMP
jgi:hypothetical protein